MTKKDEHLYPRKQVFFKNYDLYETEGVDGPAKEGPGTGFYQNMSRYKSVMDFRKKRQKSRKRKIALLSLACGIDINYIDFPTDEIGNIIPFSTENQFGIIDNIIPEGRINQIGIIDTINPELEDEENHPLNKIYYGTKDDEAGFRDNPFGFEAGNKFVNEEPDAVENQYFGILDSHLK